MSVRSRIAFASGAAGAVGAALLLSGRYEGSVVFALLLVYSIRTASLGSLVDAGPILAAGALRGLRARAWIAPVWVLVVVAAVLRAGSTALADVRGANAVAGVALANGPPLTIAGSWFAFGAAILAVLTWSPLGAETEGRSGVTARVVPPSGTTRLDALGVLGEAALAVSLFVGPQVVDGIDAVWWAAPIAAIVAAVALARRGTVSIPALAPRLPAALAVVGVVLVLIGGAP